MATTARFRHIVLGCGAIGAATAFWLAERSGGDVLVLEQYQIGHELGASEDHSRIIRYAYHSTDYTSLGRASYAAWHEVERRTGRRLIVPTGGLDLGIGADGERQVASYAAALAAVGISSTALDAAGIRARWPQWHIDDDVVALYQADSGILDIRRANAAHVALARQAGVTFADRTPVRRLVSLPDRVEAHTDAGTFAADSLVLAAGSWTGPLAESLGVRLPITLTQEQVTYYATANLDEFGPERFGIWIWHGPDRTYYGFPVYGEAAVKAGRDVSGTIVTQETRSWDPDPAQRDELTAFLAAHLPAALGPELVTKTCVYDLTPDRNFILDLLPGHPRIAVFVGAGHAAKFAGLAGSILADLARDGGTDHPIAPFAADRPALTDPAHPTDFLFTGAAAGH
ncbi:N-methyl-L-tryptophan oxidase [Dactylosporangium sp. CA-092794]|uniref:N-methyl-L-tryptophan oxidase n=1 Tax=Dactylosporangium sp. CA-092794 TaxID=3239929 RepID=UPI003D932684